jgi:hypothetical protein
MQGIRTARNGERNDRVWHTGLRGWCAVLVVAVSLVGGPLWAARDSSSTRTRRVNGSLWAGVRR